MKNLITKFTNRTNPLLRDPGQSRLNRPQVWESGSLGSDESRKSFDLYVL